MQYGPLMIDLEGIALNAAERILLKHPQVGGIILFSRNFQEIEQLKALVQEIRGFAQKPLLLAVDHEGGRIWRFNQDFKKIPAAKHYGELYERDSVAALKLAYDSARIMATELLDCGIDLSLAPVLDLDKGFSEVIGDRAFHRDPIIATALAKAFIAGMNAAGMQATGKHFPGHGGCALDSHIAQPVDTRSLEELLADDLIPFAKLSPILGAVMPAHVVYPAVDALPAGFSKLWLQAILRQQLKFKGVIISDCLSMRGAAIEGDYATRAKMALEAGCDMVILCQQTRELVAGVLDDLDYQSSAASQERLATLAGDFDNPARNPQWKHVKDGYYSDTAIGS